MSNEIIYIRFLQISVSILTLVFFYSIYKVKQGNVSLHRKVNTYALILVVVAVIGLVITKFCGFDYSTLCSPREMIIHRSFSVPLVFCLFLSYYTGRINKIKAHKIMSKISLFFWLGTLVTALLFF